MFKKLLYLMTLCISFVVTSCSSNDIELPDQSSLVTRSIWDANYDESIPVYRWYRYENATNADHFINRTPKTASGKQVFDGMTYSYEYQEFRFPSKEYGASTKKLRYAYDSSNKDHYLAVTTGTAHEYIYKSYQPGTIPLKIYYNEAKKDHHYVALESEIQWMSLNDPSYTYQGILGWGYPGTRTDNLKSDEFFHFKFAANFTGHTMKPMRMVVVFKILSNGVIKEVNKEVLFSGTLNQEHIVQVPKLDNGVLTNVSAHIFLVEDPTTFCGLDNLMDVRADVQGHTIFVTDTNIGGTPPGYKDAYKFRAFLSSNLTDYHSVYEFQVQTSGYQWP